MSNHENYRNEIKATLSGAGMTMSEVVEVLADEYGMEQQRPQPVREIKAWFFTLWRGGGVGGCAGVRHCVAETEEIRSSRKFMGTSVFPPESK